MFGGQGSSVFGTAYTSTNNNNPIPTGSSLFGDLNANNNNANNYGSLFRPAATGNSSLLRNYNGGGGFSFGAAS
jgi:hypothetical protein